MTHILMRSTRRPLPDGYCIDLFWALLETRLATVRQYIQVDLRTQIRKQFDDLESYLIDMPENEIGLLADAIRRARTETSFGLDAMREWFTLPTPSSALPFTVAELIDVALATVKHLKPEFNPDVTISCDNIPPISGALRLFSDVFFSLFENIGIYSGTPTRPRIYVEVNEQGNQLFFKVQNKLSPSFDYEKSELRISAARETIESGAYLSAVRREGGTGLPKLAKLLKLKSETPPLRFYLNREERTFTVEFELNYAEIATRARNAHEGVEHEAAVS